MTINSPQTTRPQIIKRLERHAWFRNTSTNLQQEITSLPPDYDGFLEDLASRPDEIGELDILKLKKIAHGHFLILLVFDVRSNITNQIFTYEYASWKTGSRPGARGIIFLEDNGKITHFIVTKAHKFSSMENVYDSIGGLYLHFFDNKAYNLPKKIEEEICFHLGVDELEFKQVIDLGRCHPDYGMTNNQSDLYAAVIDISHKHKIVVKDTFRTTHKPVGIEVEIIPISNLPEYINKIEDNYFLSAAARIMVSQEIDLGI